MTPHSQFTMGQTESIDPRRAVFAVAFVVIIMGVTTVLGAREISSLGSSGELATGTVAERFQRPSVNHHQSAHCMLRLTVPNESLTYVAEVDKAVFESLRAGDTVRFLRVPGDANSAVVGDAEEARRNADLGKVLFPVGLLAAAAGLGALIWLSVRGSIGA